MLFGFEVLARLQNCFDYRQKSLKSLTWIQGLITRCPAKTPRITSGWYSDLLRFFAFQSVFCIWKIQFQMTWHFKVDRRSPWIWDGDTCGTGWSRCQWHGWQGSSNLFGAGEVSVNCAWRCGPLLGCTLCRTSLWRTKVGLFFLQNLDINDLKWFKYTYVFKSFQDYFIVATSPHPCCVQVETTEATSQKSPKRGFFPFGAVPSAKSTYSDLQWPCLRRWWGLLATEHLDPSQSRRMQSKRSKVSSFALHPWGWWEMPFCSLSSGKWTSTCLTTRPVRMMYQSHFAEMLCVDLVEIWCLVLIAHCLSLLAIVWHC